MVYFGFCTKATTRHVRVGLN
ncbi:UNVERIFIED_CONTAM: hypothetical protein GTU68_031894 [Idotea baltica]|nr:hypothetical protein [Idotea baltica]